MKRCLVLVSFFVLVLVLSNSTYPAETIKIGILQEPKTLNIWMATDTWSSKILSLIYPTMFLRDPETLKLVPWLAEEKPKLDLSEKSFVIRLRNLKWSDGTPLTAEDLYFTGNVIMKYKIPHFYNRWDLVEKMEIIDQHTVKFYLKELTPLYESRTLLSPIVQKKEWENVVKSIETSQEPLKQLLNYKVKDPVSIGPFIVSEVKEGSYIFLRPNPHFEHPTIAPDKGPRAMRRVGIPHHHNIIFKVFGTTDTAILELKKGGIDYLWWNLPEGYIADLGKVNGVKIFSSKKNALYFLGFNLRREPMTNAFFRKAVATLIDKEFLVKRLLQGKGVEMDSPISPGNKEWYCEAGKSYGKGLFREERRKLAVELLKEGGFNWKVSPSEQGGWKAKGLVAPSGEEVGELSVLVPPADYDPVRAMAGTMIQEWLQEVGIPVKARPMPFNALVEQVKSRKDYDMVIMGYSNLTLDPDYLRRFFGSEQQTYKGDNITGYSSQRFDQLAEASSKCMDLEERKKIVCEMQKVLKEDLPVIPLYNPYIVEAVRMDRFKGWVPGLGGVGNLWTFLNLTPAKEK